MCNTEEDLKLYNWDYLHFIMIHARNSEDISMFLYQVDTANNITEQIGDSDGSFD